MLTGPRAAPAACLFLFGSVLLAAPARAADTDPPIVIVGQRGASDASVDADRLAETTTLLNPEDSLRYLPSLLVRKRHIGDTQAPLATRTSGVGASARSLIYVDGILLSALIGNNNSTASPRWAMISPEEIARVDVLYGPFSAAHPGNSVGAVVAMTTRLPDKAEGSLKAATSVQSFDQYGSHGLFPSYQLAGTLGGRAGRLRWFVAADAVDSRGQPLAYVTVARGAAGSGGLAVGGGYADVNRAGAPIWVIGAGGIEAQRQETLKVHLAYDLAANLRLSYRGGLFLNATSAEAESYLSRGGPVYAGSLNLGGTPASVPAGAFSSNVYRLAERHWMHALSLEGRAGGWSWRALGSIYDFDKDAQRLPSGALPAAQSGGPGVLVRLDGTGWQTLDIDLHRGGFGAGAHHDRFTLRSERGATADWLRGAEGPLAQAARGHTRTDALWAEQGVALAHRLRLTLGGRYEWWRAYGGFNFSAAPALAVTQPTLSRATFSPKATLGFQPARGWSLTLSTGQAWRFPTVQELYQAISTGPTLTVPDPHLRPERARSEELAIERRTASGRIRLSLFNEAVRDALISQTAPLVPGSTTLFSYVQNIGATRTRGLELAFEQRGVPIPALDLSGSITLTDPKVLRDAAFPAAEGKLIPQVPRRRATLVATWHAGGGAAFTLAGRYASRSYATIDNSDPIGHTYQGFEGYVVLDARATVAVGQGWRWAVGVENLTDRRYYLFHPFPGRTVTAELRYGW
ncbi:MAG: TonB-dependent receptor [Alphaproteobacteria bacterium]|nr:TonB-dependent receptor [Alphaproteobacteria bacterium]